MISPASSKWITARHSHVWPVAGWLLVPRGSDGRPATPWTSLVKTWRASEVPMVSSASSARTSRSKPPVRICDSSLANMASIRRRVSSGRLVCRAWRSAGSATSPRASRSRTAVARGRKLALSRSAILRVIFWVSGRAASASRSFRKATVDAGADAKVPMAFQACAASSAARSAQSDSSSRADSSRGGATGRRVSRVASQSRTVPSVPRAARVLPSAEKPMSRTGPSCTTSGGKVLPLAVSSRRS